MIVLFVTMAWSVATAQQPSLSTQIARTPDMRNGYEDYIRAAEKVSSWRARQLIHWLPNQEEYPLEDNPSPLAIEQARFQKKIRGWTQLQVYRELATTYGSALDLVRIGNRKEVYDPRASVDPSEAFPETLLFSSLSKLFLADAYVKFADGNSAAGTDSLLQSMTFGSKIGGGNLMAALRGMALNAIPLSQFEKRLRQLSIADCLRVRQAADALAAERPPVERSLRGEMQFSIASFDLDIEHPENGFSDLDEGELKSAMAVFSRMTPAQKKEAKDHFNGLMSELFERLGDRLKMPEREWENADQDVQPIVGSERNPSIAAVLRSMLPVYGVTFRAAATQRTQYRLLALHARVLNFKWENGRLPDKLTEVAEAKLIHDPMSGGDFQYEISPGGYRLYSKGSKSSGEIDLTYRRPPSGSRGRREPDEPPDEGASLKSKVQG